MRHAWDAYWAWTGGNIGAMPLEALITMAATTLSAVLFRRPLARAAGWLQRAWNHETRTALADLRRELSDVRGSAEKARASAAAAHQITADLYRHHASEDHPLAPDQEAEAK